MSAWDLAVSKSGPYLGPASYSHIKGHPAYGTQTWWIGTDLDDYKLAPYVSQENAAIGWMLAEAIIAARRAGGDW